MANGERRVVICGMCATRLILCVVIIPNTAEELLISNVLTNEGQRPSPNVEASSPMHIILNLMLSGQMARARHHTTELLRIVYAVRH